MASIYERALGDAFKQLHPRIQERFGYNSQNKIASIGRGVMERIWYAKWAAFPLYIGTTRHIMFPQGGRNVPFTIENYAYRDSFGRETVTWIRKFKFPNQVRRFDATMIYSEQRHGIVDYLGNKQHLAVDLTISAEANGGIRIRSGDQRFYERWLQFRFPPAFTGIADVCEWYDDTLQQYKISVEVNNPLLGPVFRYNGAFQAWFIPMERSEEYAMLAGAIIPIPLDVLPLREESRE